MQVQGFESSGGQKTGSNSNVGKSQGSATTVLVSPAPITTVETGQTTTSPLAMYMEAEKCNGGLAGGAVQSNSGDCLDCEVDKQTPGFEIIIRDTDERH